MSYCVNCGVELDDSAKKCALCGAPVLNPYLDEPEEALPPPYPDRLALPEDEPAVYCLPRFYGAAYSKPDLWRGKPADP